MNRKFWIYSGLGLILLGIIGKIKKMSTFKNNVAKLALSEWNAWNIPTKVKEGNSRTMQRLRDYWQKGAKVNGTDEYFVNTAWSAAFISYVMRFSGAGANFPYSARHSVYITKAIKNRKENNSKAFKGYKPSEVNLEIGDLICYARQEGVNYDTTGNYASHCDIVTNLTDTEAETIGGNVSNSVTKTKVKLKNGKILSDKYFVVIKNNL